MNDRATRGASGCSSCYCHRVSAPLRPRSAASPCQGMSYSSLETDHRWDALPGPCLQVGMAVVEVVAAAASGQISLSVCFQSLSIMLKSRYECCPGPAAQCITTCTNTLEQALRVCTTVGLCLSPCFTPAYVCAAAAVPCLALACLLCAQAIAQHLGPSDSLAARSACSTWASAIPLPQLSLSLTVTPSGGLTSQAADRLRALLLATQHNSTNSAFAQVRYVALRLSPGSSSSSSSDATDATAAHQPAHHHHQQQQPAAVRAASSEDAALSLLSQALATLPSVCSLAVSIHSPKQQQAILVHTPSRWQATVHDCHTVLLQLLALPQLQQQLSRLTLACEGLWPSHQHVGAALQQLSKLTTLQLHKCPVSALTRLPSLPLLQQLAVSGRWMEPVPRSYSFRQLPLLPLLPGLQQLSIQQLPLDVQCQEEADRRIWQHQQQRAAATAAAAALSRREGQAGEQPPCAAPRGSQAVCNWQLAQQWVSSSICKQCPNLLQLQSDMVLGQAVQLMPQLKELRTPQLLSGSADTFRSDPAGAAAAASLAAVAVGRSRSHVEAATKTPAASSSTEGCAALAACQGEAWCRCRQRVAC